MLVSGDMQDQTRRDKVKARLVIAIVCPGTACITSCGTSFSRQGFWRACRTVFLGRRRGQMRATAEAMPFERACLYDLEYSLHNISTLYSLYDQRLSCTSQTPTPTLSQPQSPSQNTLHSRPCLGRRQSPAWRLRIPSLSSFLTSSRSLQEPRDGQRLGYV